MHNSKGAHSSKETKSGQIIRIEQEQLKSTFGVLPGKVYWGREGDQSTIRVDRRGATKGSAQTSALSETCQILRGCIKKAETCIEGAVKAFSFLLPYSERDTRSIRVNGRIEVTPARRVCDLFGRTDER